MVSRQQVITTQRNSTTDIQGGNFVQFLGLIFGTLPLNLNSALAFFTNFVRLNLIFFEAYILMGVAFAWEDLGR